MGKASRILVIDDDRDILDLLQYNLKKEGFTVKGISDSCKAVEASLKFRPNLIILDLVMPQLNGMEVCKQLRSIDHFSETYIFFLTAKSESYYQEEAFDIGGDDFIDKVIGLRALTHKVVTVLKRDFVIRKRENELVRDKLVINRKESTVTVEGKRIKLLRPELELLFFLAQNPKKTITSDHLMNNIWGSDILASIGSLETHLESLMYKLGGNWVQEIKKDRYRFGSR